MGGNHQLRRDQKHADEGYVLKGESNLGIATFASGDAEQFPCSIICLLELYVGPGKPGVQGYCEQANILGACNPVRRRHFMQGGAPIRMETNKIGASLPYPRLSPASITAKQLLVYRLES
jgi:hypothetical protein